MKIICIIFICIHLISCKKNTETITTSETEKIEEIAETNSEKKVISKTFKMLQGTWVNSLNPRSSLEFKDNRVLNKYDTIENKTIIYFTIGDTCNNTPNNGALNEKDKYISTTGDASECYYIIKLDDKNLEMSYLGESHTLKFVKKE